MQPPLKRIGLGLVPRFIFAGLLSSAYSLIALKKSELHEGANDVITLLVGGACLGLLLVAALWFYKRLDSWRTAGFLVVIMSVANALSLFAKYVPESLRPDNAIPLLGVTDRYEFVLLFPTCFVAFIGFAIVLLRWRNTLRTVPAALACSVLATFSFNYLVQQGRAGWFNPFHGDVLGILWQMNLVFFLALALWVGQISIGAGLYTDQAFQASSSRSTRNGSISLAILVGCFIGVQLWTSALILEERKRDAEHSARVRSVLAHAPSRENPSPLLQEPAENVLLMDIPGYTRYGPRIKVLRDEDALPVVEKTIPRALYPERYFYTATYADNLMLDSIEVDITAYPTADWASYYVKPMPVLYPGNVWNLVKFGNRIYQAGTSFIWPSGNKVIRLNCRLARQPAIDALVQAYLREYPSSL